MAESTPEKTFLTFSGNGVINVYVNGTRVDSGTRSLSAGDKIVVDGSAGSTITVNGETKTEGATIETSETDITIVCTRAGFAPMVTLLTINIVAGQKSVDLTTLSGWANLADGTHTITIKAKADGYRDSQASAVVEVTKGSSTVTLEAGTYLINEQPALNIALDMNLTGKMNTLTADNTYGGQTTFDNFYAAISSTAESGVINFGNNDEYVQYAWGDWSFVSSDGDTCTASDTTKLRTIILETDQEVSQEFYDWAITQGNLVKQTSTGETWLLNEEPHFSPLVDTTEFEVPFSINSVTYSVLRFESELVPMHTDAVSISVSSASIVQTSIYYSGSWTNDAYRTITFETAPTSDLLTWLQANGTKQGNLIEFTIAGTSYQAEQGMTWQQWVDSSYNTSNGRYLIQGGYLKWTGGSVSGPTANSSLAKPKASDAPQNNGVYYENISGGGGAN